MKNKIHSASALFVLLMMIFSAPAKSFAQCKDFVNQQTTMLSPYVLDGKKNYAILQPGDHSELKLTFYSGNTYRIMVKSGDNQEHITFVIKDADNKVLFTNKEDLKASYFDFTSETTQLLTIEMMALEGDVLAKAANGSECVCVLVGCMD